MLRGPTPRVKPVALLPSVSVPPNELPRGVDDCCRVRLPTPDPVVGHRVDEPAAFLTDSSLQFDLLSQDHEADATRRDLEAIHPFSEHYHSQRRSSSQSRVPRVCAGRQSWSVSSLLTSASISAGRTVAVWTAGVRTPMSIPGGGCRCRNAWSRSRRPADARTRAWTSSVNVSTDAFDGHTKDPDLDNRKMKPTAVVM